ncbi:16S rRNA (cytosine(1402)-N(4))-methyltransferase RsmH [Corynebacterium sp. ES2794-CONJ1]|uniref:16S rRNA (cytosine(1402)-N(4))-methyltransferase RsmH n=1 Tax=unclassified Corynebacterium TaxID=2624378 RepID=UPI002169C803|nr:MULTISPECIES: 16S rRNA (cytosine(1402)-N(4))-methyltransferase RsmH [unclassified Corynebacterium]MCS4489007.1 16S rRNA (cytosine(1402)-N(4))-methyltransferase RsmH [Corynebacterium sp. ES2775-CONJ]MCS4490820.1 16S rRNA (cytosine(1402)-N(4))-methyltransferase RsmH [Corynebacterium sp. ES2715-CONJ3]MCS4531297.1 16S rRNA (cytosine(1402)-N(4))-methyltransferase RsmH [Corynebacterium sp. ES2730-CONJ]MCU9518666.1 16S rRNA (cytosine(1402)-N(4))-methyltransferase RsmH [Corynebacterium sp. ES2794-CO
MVDSTTQFDHTAANHGHIPVMRDRIVELLSPAVELMGDNAVIIDGTLGAGGHSESLLNTFTSVHIIGLDRDERALDQARERLKPFGSRFIAFNTRFDRFLPLLRASDAPGCTLLKEFGLTGALFDLGVSSMQLDQIERGFAYRVDAPLDMRMDGNDGLTAADILNTYSHGDLARLLKTYGEERFAGKIATAIVKEREKAPFVTSARLVELLYATIPAATRRTGGHPAKRTFQALRIEVNKELEAIENVLPVITDLLAPGGRCIFMAYQSLEDKIVKNYFKKITADTTPLGLPVHLPDDSPRFKLLTRGAEKASATEIDTNPRSAPVRVRAVQAIKEGIGS